MNERTNAQKLHPIVFVLLLAAIAVSVYALNAHTPLMMDDYDYSVSWATGKPLSGLGDVIASQIAHYRLWGGRSVTHTLAQMFLMWGKGVFNFANTAAYICLLLEIYMLAYRKDRPFDWRLVLLAHGALMFFVPFFGVVFLWLDGACNYLWGTALALLPLVIARSEREGGFFDTDGARGLLALPVCLIAGWTNENTACGVLAALVLLLGYDKLKGRRIRGWRVAAALAQALGTALMLLAPGNFARSSAEASRGIVMELVYRFAVVSYCAARYAGLPALAAAAAMLLARRRRAALRVEWLALLGACALLCAYALVGSPQISDRSFTAVIVLVLAAALAAYADMPHGRMSAAALAVLALACALGSWQAIGDVRAHEAAWNAQLAYAGEAKAAGQTRVQIESVPSDSRFTMSIILEKDASLWPNSTLSKALGIDIYSE